MTTTYWDSSALIKRYIQETGSDWVRTLMSPNTDHVWLTARITMVEFHSALAHWRGGAGKGQYRQQTVTSRARRLMPIA